MSDSFEWMRIAIAMGLMFFGFILLPAFFLVRDKRQDDREAAAARELQDSAISTSETFTSETSSSTHNEAGASR